MVRDHHRTPPARRHALRFGGTSVALVLGLVLSVDCAPEGEVAPSYCGACKTGQEGVVSVAGDPRLDGVLLALDHVERGIIRNVESFDAAVVRLAAAHGLPSGHVTAQYVEDLVRVIDADVADHVTGPVRTIVEPPSCAFDMREAVLAQQRCERGDGCETGNLPNPLPSTCHGRCIGACDGVCTGSLACGRAAPTTPCEERCEGACVPSVPSVCEGQCRGTCDETCSRVDAYDRCDGLCDGLCDGACVPDVPGPCAGTCHGGCWTTPDASECFDTPLCRGTCEGLCSGECEGDVTPPILNGDCETASLCQRSARAQSIGALRCSPGSIRFEYDLPPDLPPQEAAAFISRMDALAVAAPTAQQSAAYLSLMVLGQRDGQEVLVPTPLERLSALTVETSSAAEQEGVTPPPGRAECLEPALAEAEARIAGQVDGSSRARLAAAVFMGLLD